MTRTSTRSTRGWLALSLGFCMLAGVAGASSSDLAPEIDPYARPADVGSEFRTGPDSVMDGVRSTPTADATDPTSTGTLARPANQPPRNAAPTAGCPAGVTAHVLPGESIQTAVDAASPGDRLIVAPGVYSESVLVETACLTLKGGWSPHASEWAVMDGAGVGEYGFRVAADAVTIEGFEIHGHVDGVYSFATGAHAGTVKRNWIHDNARRAVFLGTGPTGVYPTGWTIKANRIGAHGLIGLPMVRASEVVIKDNDVEGTSGGIFFLRVSGGSITNNRVTASTSFGINLNGSSGNEVKDNEVVGSGVRGMVLIWGSNDNLVKENLFVDSGAEGIYLFLGPSFRNLIQDNLVLDSAGDGISLTSNTLDASDNVFRDNVASGSATGCDLYWDGGGSGNCWQGNSGSECPAPLPSCN